MLLRSQFHQTLKTLASSGTHFRAVNTPHPLYLKPANQLVFDPADDNPTPHAIWTKEELDGVTKTHVPVNGFVDGLAYGTVKLVRHGFDLISGYSWGKVNDAKFLRRVLFLETVAGIPGMVAGSLRHLLSLRSLRADGGWIHTLIEEAENERMHMLIFKNIYNPSPVLRGAILLAQGIMWNLFFLSYLVCPRLCHRFVGYLEEEAVKTYSDALNRMQPGGELYALGQSPAPKEAIQYWRLPENAKIVDVTYAVRADEASHRDVNHHFSDLCREKADPAVSTQAASRAV